MDRELVSLQPEIIQFNNQERQLIKVTNNSNELIDNCYFCLFNTNRYQFVPESFQLQAKQHKLISVVMKAKILGGQGKEFGYLKSRNFNKRITLINVDQMNEQEEEKLRSAKSSQDDDLHSLSQRAYRENQKVAHERIVAQKQAYIDRLERMLEEQESANKSRIHLNQITELEMKVSILMKQNMQLREKYSQNFKLKESDRGVAGVGQLMGDKMKEMGERIQYLEKKCEEYLKKIAEMEQMVRENEIYYVQKIDSIIRQGQRRMQEMQDKMVQKKRKSQRLNKNLQEHNEELKEKLRDHEKLHYHNRMLSDDGMEGKERRKGRDNLEKEIIEEVRNRWVYESKTRKLEQFINNLQESIKDLKEERMKQTQKTHERVINLQSQNIDMIQKMNVGKRKDTIHTRELEQIKLQLKEKENKYDERQEKYKRLIQKYQYELKYNQRQIQKYQYNERLLKDKLIEVEEAKQKITKKIQKYKKETRKQLRSIKDNTKDELKRIQKQKTKISQKVSQLQLSAQNPNPTITFPQKQNSENRHRTKSYYETDQQQNERSKKNRLRLSHQGHLMTKKAEIRNLGKQVQGDYGDSEAETELERVYGELGKLTEFRNCVNNSIKRLKQVPYIKELIGQGNNHNEKQISIFWVINFLKELEYKMGKQEREPQKLLESEKEVEFLKGRLAELEPLARKRRVEKESISQQSEIATIKNEQERNIVEYIRQQMRSQYKKIYEALKLSQQSNKILKQKVYQQYRTRIIESISKKEHDEYTLSKIEVLLERFIEGLGNLSHHHAILAKEVRLKQQARKEISQLKNKLTCLSKSMEHGGKKSSCIREQMGKIMEGEKGREWFDGIRVETKMLTVEAENVRLEQEVQVGKSKLRKLEEQLKLCQVDLETKQNQLLKLKKEVIYLTRESKHEMGKQEEEIVELKKKINGSQKMEKQGFEGVSKDRENDQLKEEIMEKKLQIKNLKEKEKLLEQLLNESKRNQSAYKEKQKKEYLNESRMQQSLRDLKENNRELRNQNTRLKQQIEILIDEMNKKNANLKRLKSEKDEVKVNHTKNDQQNLQKLKVEIRQLREEINKVKQDSEKIRKRKDRELQEKKSEFEKMRNEYSIQKSSLQSIIRALIDTLSGIYCSLDILARKKGSIVSQSPNFSEFMRNPLGIRSSQIRQLFEDVIQALKP